MNLNKVKSKIIGISYDNIHQYTFIYSKYDVIYDDQTLTNTYGSYFHYNFNIIDIVHHHDF